MFLERDLVFTNEVVREWEAQLAPLLSEPLRKHRRGRIGPSWYVDETFIKVKGRRYGTHATTVSQKRGTKQVVNAC